MRILELPWCLSGKESICDQETWVWPLVRGDPTCCGAAKPMHRHYWACALKPGSHSCRAQTLQLLKLVLCNKKLPQWGASSLQGWVALTLHNWRKNLHSIIVPGLLFENLFSSVWNFFFVYFCHNFLHFVFIVLCFYNPISKTKFYSGFSLFCLFRLPFEVIIIQLSD